ncbi:MAG: DUF3108 domain-containing protein [Elusimicrobium sp.]|jgi:hypothetical protein|nr:DUF3108 domain-containing protein [Elusimicrobium sp.]
MKQILTALILPLAAILNGCCCCNCKPQDTPPPAIIEIPAPAAQTTRQNTQNDIAPAKETEGSPLASALESALGISEEAPAPAQQTEQEPVFLSKTTQPKAVRASAAAAEANKEQTKKPETKKEPVPASYVRDGRYLHPWAKNPVIEGGQKLYPAPWSDEEMRFGVHYSFIRAGTAYIKTDGVTETSFGPAYKIETLANSAKAIDSVFKVRDINYSWISVKDYSSYGYSQSIREGNYIRDEWVSFDAAQKKFIGSKKKKGDAELIKGALEGPVQDMLTSLYFVRLHAPELSAGKSVTFDVNDGDTTYPLIVRFIKKETLKTPAGKFNCIVVEPGFRKEGIFIQKGKSLKVWLTDDERRIPVKMETEVFIGSVSASLEEYKKGK